MLAKPVLLGMESRVMMRVAQPVYALGDIVAVTAMFALSILNVAAGSYSPFLYFRF